MKLRAGSGFTLIELAVALAILGLVTSTIYLALDGALRSEERLHRAQEPYQRGRVARGFIAGSLRSATPSAGFPGDGLVAVDSVYAGLPSDELTFVAVTPAGRGGRMQIRLRVSRGDGTPSLEVGVREFRALPDSAVPYKTTTLSRGVAGLEIEYLAAPSVAGSVWQPTWPSEIILPQAVRIQFVPADAPDPAYRTPLLVHLPAGKML